VCERPGTRRLLALLLAAVALGLGACDPNGVPPPRARHLLLVTLDTTRADRLGCYGHAGAETPTLDRLAASGVRFATAYTVAPVTLPAHASILTGRYPPAHGVRDNGKFALSDDALTLAEVLRGAGFRTGAFVSAVVLARMFGTAQGFEKYDDRSINTRVADHGIQDRPANYTTDAAIEWLSGLSPATERIFLWIHYFDPHLPYDPPEPFRSRHDDLYDAEIAFADSEIGRLLGSLGTVSAPEDVLVVVMSDHGESLGEHGEVTHGIFVYDATVRVPLILAHPSLPAGRVIAKPVSVVDVMPTVLALLGVKAPAADGQDLTPLLVMASPEDPTERSIYVESEYGHHSLGWAPLYGVRRGRYKLVDAPRSELYDLERDPAELTDLAPSEPAVKTVLAEELERFMPAGETERASRPAVLDEVSRQALEALGYVDAPDGERPQGDDRPDPKDAIGYIAARERGRLALGKGRFAEARAALEEVLARSPGDEVTLGMLGILALHQQRWSDAEVTFTRILQRRAVSPALLYNLAIATHHLGRHAEVAELLREATTLDPSFAPAYRLLVTHHRMQADEAIARGDVPTAVRELGDALTQCRRLLEVWYGDPAPLGELRQLESGLVERLRALEQRPH
jgi:arylsulfatase A-like enzyme